MRLRDGLKNLVASIGTEKDKASYTQWRAAIRTADEWEQIYRGSAFGRKIVDIPVDDMMRRWRGWSADSAFIEGIEAAEKRYGVPHKVASAKRWARLYGSSAIIVGAAQRLGPPEEPLDVSKMQRGDLRYLHVDIYPRLQIEAWESDIESAGFGEPRIYLYRPEARGAATGASVRVHASRVIPFSGLPLPPMTVHTLSGWGDSVYAPLEDQLNTAGSALAVIASLLFETKTDIIKTDLSGIGTEEGEDRIKQRFALAALLKSINNTLLLGKDEEFEQKTFDFQGLPEIHTRLLQELSGAADIPATRFLSQAPAGLQATGESDYRNYADSISAKQEAELRPGLERLDPILIANEGLRAGRGTYFTFRPLWQESEKEKADNALKRAQSAEIIARTGLIPDSVLRKAVVSQLAEAGTYPGLDDAMSKYEASVGDMPDEPGGDEDEDAAEGEGIVPFARRAANDAAPRTLYVSRKLKNGADLLAWAKAQGFTDLYPASELHVTIAYSRTPVDWMAAGQIWFGPEVKVEAGGPRLVEPLGEHGLIVLLFASDDLSWRWRKFQDIGASWDHAEYQPHVSFAHSAAGVDLDKVRPYQGPLVFGPEIFAEIDEDWAPEKALVGS